MITSASAAPQGKEDQAYAWQSVVQIHPALLTHLATPPAPRVTGEPGETNPWNVGEHSNTRLPDPQAKAPQRRPPPQANRKHNEGQYEVMPCHSRLLRNPSRPCKGDGTPFA